jgi:hypothetical protein
MVGAESEVCPRCGVNFRAAITRRITLWTIIIVIALVLAVGRFALHVI